MEKRDLVYVWVNSNDGILNEVSVNLGSAYRFGITKDGEQLHLTAERNDTFIADLFKIDGSGLSNMTVLLGKNGSGKTRLCRLIGRLTAGDYTAAEYVAVIAVEDKSGVVHYEVFHQPHKHDLAEELPLENIQRVSELNLGGAKAVYYSPIIDFRDDNYYGDRPKWIDVSRNQRLYRLIEDRKRSIARSFRGAAMELMRSEDIKHELEYLNNDVAQIQALNAIIPQHKSRKYLMGAYRTRSTTEGLIPAVSRILDDAYMYLNKWIEGEEAEKELNAVQGTENMLTRKFLLKNYYSDVMHGFIQSYSQNLLYYINNSVQTLEIPDVEERHPLDIIRSFLKTNPVTDKITLCSSKLIDELADSAAYVKNAPFHEVFKFSLGVDRALRLLLLTNELERAWNDNITEYRHDRLQVPFLLFDRPWSLSSGEKFYLSLFSSLYLGAEWIQKELSASGTPIPDGFPIYVVLDEVDNGLHPAWQQGLVKSLVEALPALFERHLKVRPRLHVIMATHSPIVLSDIPREHVVVLKDSDSMVTPAELDMQTFGANIHNLYRNSFFLTDHMLGMLAYDKIQGVVNDLTREGVTTIRAGEMRKIIDQIGEPVIRTKLRRMHEDKFGEGLTDEERLRFHEEEIRKIKARRKDEDRG